MGQGSGVVPLHVLQVRDQTYLETCFEEIKGGDSPYALVQINIKNFRYYNTKYGVSAGNEILVLVLEKLTELLQEEEYGGWLYADNFCLLLRYETEHQLVYERMMDAIDKIYRIPDDRIYRNICYSMGIHLIKDQGTTFLDALNYANLCRKECDTLFNRSTCLEVYDETFCEKYMGRMALEVATAEAYKNYEFVTHLQPKVEIATGRIVGAEALLRWFDREGKLIPLMSYLPILNANHCIEIVDLDMFDQMCAHLERRRVAGKPVVPISFNLSKATFYDPNILGDYSRTVEKYQIPRELIEIELMESISMDDCARMNQVIADFKAAGFTCSLDDFGNGYSSFGVLLNAQLDIVKLDRQFFLANLNGDSKHMIETVVNLIHSLGMKVVAEGVELEEHVDCLRACGCDFSQGFYYYKPMPIDAFAALLDAQAEQL